MQNLDDQKLQEAITLVNSVNGYQVLSKIKLSENELGDSIENAEYGLILDLETTGLDINQDKIVEICILPFYYDPNTMEVLSTEPPITMLEDPGIPIPAEATKVNGITDEMVSGMTLDTAKITNIIAKSDIVIAHNASFDRPFFEKRFTSLSNTSWACSLREVLWNDYGFSCQKLGCLLRDKNHETFDAHRAEADCQALLSLLREPFEDGKIPLNLLISNANSPSFLIRATNAPFEHKDILKARGYRWDDGASSGSKAWWKNVTNDELIDEEQWLDNNVYMNSTDHWQKIQQSAKTRYQN